MEICSFPSSGDEVYSHYRGSVARWIAQTLNISRLMRPGLVAGGAYVRKVFFRKAGRKQLMSRKEVREALFRGSRKSQLGSTKVTQLVADVFPTRGGLRFFVLRGF